jgi:Acetyltransferases
MVIKAEIKDMNIVAGLAVLMWDNHSVNELADDFSEILSTGKAQFFLKYETDIPVGFAQCQLRYDYVEGTETSPVGYLEGIFIKKEYRNKGYAKELLEECERWAKSMGCQEFASDCEADNSDSFHFHKAVSFTEANRIICFTKKL